VIQGRHRDVSFQKESPSRGIQAGHGHHAQAAAHVALPLSPWVSPLFSAEVTKTADLTSAASRAYQSGSAFFGTYGMFAKPSRSQKDLQILQLLYCRSNSVLRT